MHTGSRASCACARTSRPRVPRHRHKFMTCFGSKRSCKATRDPEAKVTTRKCRLLRTVKRLKARPKGVHPKVRFRMKYAVRCQRFVCYGMDEMYPNNQCHTTRGEERRMWWEQRIIADDRRHTQKNGRRKRSPDRRLDTK